MLYSAAVCNDTSGGRKGTARREEKKKSVSDYPEGKRKEKD